MKPIVAAPAIAALLYRAWSRQSLTPIGLVAAGLTASVHALHPWSVFFALLGIFFLGGTAVTKVKHDIKARLTLASGGDSGGEKARTHVQVLANSLAASVLILVHLWIDRPQTQRAFSSIGSTTRCFAPGLSPADVVAVGIIANYAAVAGDTFSSELGILSTSPPRLITSLSLRQVPPGTNGGVSLLGSLAGFLGGAMIAVSTTALIPFCPDQWTWADKVQFTIAITAWGGLGSLLDSFLGGWLQASVVDRRTGKVVEGIGGRTVPHQAGVEAKEAKGNEDEGNGKLASRYVVSGTEWLDNNGVNLLMAVLMSVGGMTAANWWWNVPWH